MITVIVIVAVAVVAAGATDRVPPAPLMAGIAARPCQPGQAVQIPLGTRGTFITGSSVLQRDGQPYTGAARQPAAGACVMSAVAASRAWLSLGSVPGLGAQQQALATRALLDLRLMVRPNGAVVSGWHSGWMYSWPRDSSWVAAALAGTGHPGGAFQVLSFLQHVQSPDGTWAARYLLKGSGPVRDGRPAELDAVGWVSWAVWSWFTDASRVDKAQALSQLGQLWPMVSSAADAAARSLTADGLPAPSMDYWEDRPIGTTLGTAAPLLAGLRAAADLAMARKDSAAAGRWASAAATLSAGIGRGFAQSGFRRAAFTPGSGYDAAITFLGPPFTSPARAVVSTARAAQAALRLPNGGLRPGTSWRGPAGVAWTPETALFALFDAGTGAQAQSASLLSWLYAHRTAVGELPEQVSSSGQPVSVAPLAWTDAIVLLTLLAQSGQLPTIPVPHP